jgi:hypothetical protein
MHRSHGPRGHRPDDDPAPRVARAQGRRTRHAMVAACVALLATGLAWLVGHDLWLRPTAFGAEPRPFVAWLLRAHGAIAWFTTAVGGAVWQVHVRPAWRAARRRARARERRAGASAAWRHARARTASGVALAAALATLLVSGVGLQYAPEEAHAALSAAHWATGLALAAGLLWHWIARRR